MKGKPHVISVAVVLFFLTCVISATQAQDQVRPTDGQDQTLPRERIAKTIPNSQEIITLRFTLDDENYIIASQKDGGMIRIEKADQILGFTPYKTSDGGVAVRVFHIDRIVKAGKLIGERMVEHETYGLTNSKVDFKSEGFSSMIELVTVRDGHSQLSQMRNQPHINSIAALGDGCCVTCNGIRSCACAVETSCGGCCMWECC